MHAKVHVLDRLDWLLPTWKIANGESADFQNHLRFTRLQKYLRRSLLILQQQAPPHNCQEVNIKYVEFDALIEGVVDKNCRKLAIQACEGTSDPIRPHRPPTLTPHLPSAILYDGSIEKMNPDMPDQSSTPPQTVLSSTSALDIGYEGLRLPAVVLLDNVRSMYNVGAFFRAADGVNLEKLCLCGITAHPPKKAISKTALGAEEVVVWEHHWDAVATAENLRSAGFQIAAVETGSQAVDLFEWQPKFPLCVAFGHEVDGLRPELLDIADIHVRIPMLGKKESLNVATAAGIVLYELLRKYRILTNTR